METYPQRMIDTGRLKTAYYRAGQEHGTKLLLLHGNLSSSAFFLPLLGDFARWFDVVVPDLRCFGDSDALPIDATRGYRDWSDDIASLADALGWDRFAIGGWSMGGGVAMQYAIDHSDRLTAMVLLAPGSPFGFGGTKDEKGTPHYPAGLGSGGGCVNPALLSAMALLAPDSPVGFGGAEDEKGAPRYPGGVNPTLLAMTPQGLLLREILNSLFFTPSFRLEPQWEDIFLDAILKTKLGPDKYPGDHQIAFQWPFVSAGKRGVLNAMSPQYGNLSRLAEINPKPPVLWVRGRDDVMVSDHSMLEFGHLGSIGAVPGWPGPWLYPPQPMVAQTRYVLDRYQKNGGVYHELVIPGGHGCILESPEYFIPTLCSFLLG